MIKNLKMFFWKKLTKKSLYKKIKLKKTVEIPIEKDRFIGIHCNDINIYKFPKWKQIYQHHSEENGYFVLDQRGDPLFTIPFDKRPAEPENRVRLSERDKGELVLHTGDVFKDLRLISEKLGYKIGSEVYVAKEGKNFIISGIKNLCLYQISFSLFGPYNDKNLRTIFTLSYQLEEHFGEYIRVPGYYQIDDIELVKNVKEISVVEAAIEDNFIELIDEEVVTFSSTKHRILERSGYECTIHVKDVDPYILDRVCSQLMLLTKRLEKENISVNIKDINKERVTFTAVQN